MAPVAATMTTLLAGQLGPASSGLAGLAECDCPAYATAPDAFPAPPQPRYAYQGRAGPSSFQFSHGATTVVA